MEKTGQIEKPGKLQKSTATVRHGCTSWIVAPLMSYPRNTWSSWTLTPLWILQMFLFVDTIIAAGILVFEVEGQGSRTDRGWVVCIAFMFICILLTAAEIGLWFVRALHPWTFLGTSVFKSIFWILYFAVGIATTVEQRVIDSNLIWPFWRLWQAASISAALAVTLAALIYGSVVAHRYRRGGIFQHCDSESEYSRKESDVSSVPSPISRDGSRDGRV